MRISHGTRIKDISDLNGYGSATVQMLNSLSRLGYEVNQNDPTADVEIWMDQPPFLKFSEGPYKVHFHPWESTLLKNGWADIMNQADEVWTPSPIIAKWYRQKEITVPVYVYEHGVNEIWTPKHRKVTGTVKFLHVGMEAARKGGSETIRAFREAFPNKEDVSLTMKIISDGWKIDYLRKATIINERYSLPQMVELFHDHHVFVYPSHGEGFGLNPLQALATGMPTITVPAWAPYAEFLDPNLNIRSRLLRSQWYDSHHPGKMFKPRFDDIVDKMRYAYENYDRVSEEHFEQAPAVHERYNWDALTKQAFGNLENRLEKS